MTLHEEIESGYDNLLTMAMVITSGKVEDARDLVQDGVERMLKFRHKYTGTGFRNWAFIIMRNIFLGKKDKEKRNRKYEGSVQDIENLPGRAINKVEPTRVDMSCLTPKQRTVIVLMDCGYSGNQISEILQIPRGSVSSRVYYARRKLKAELEKRGIE